jgi:acylphosphatase
MTAVRRRIVVSGQVQGVFFRDTTLRRAEALGVAGWVRNCPDGSVEVVAEGDEDAVESLLEYCREGPPRAEVSGVDISDESPEGLRGFEVR